MRGILLHNAPILDAIGASIRHGDQTRSTDWDEVQSFCRSVDMPYRVRHWPPGPLRCDDDLGAGIHLDRF